MLHLLKEKFINSDSLAWSYNQANSDGGDVRV